MKKSFFIIALAFLVFACKENSQEKIITDNAEAIDTSAALVSDEISSSDEGNCKAGEALVWEGETFASYTEDVMRGQGVVSFTMDINDRLNILNEDDSSFGEIVLNEDMTYFTLTMPKKVIARKVIANYDFVAFDFDADNVNTNKEYLFIYINKEKKKIKKADLKFTFSTWEDYIKKQPLKLKDCNLLVKADRKANPKSKDLAFTVTQIKGDEIKIKSTKDCLGEDSPFTEMAGTIKWKSGNTLLVDLSLCN